MHLHNLDYGLSKIISRHTHDLDREITGKFEQGIAHANRLGSELELAQTFCIQHLDYTARHFDQPRFGQDMQYTGEGFRREIQLGRHYMLGCRQLHIILLYAG
jgi:hypothetical protein